MCCIGFSKCVCTYLQSNIILPDSINFVKCKYFDYSINDMGIFFSVYTIVVVAWFYWNPIY